MTDRDDRVIARLIGDLTTRSIVREWAAVSAGALTYTPYRTDTVSVEHDGPVTIVTITRPERRNAVDSLCADQLLRGLSRVRAGRAASPWPS